MPWNDLRKLTPLIPPLMKSPSTWQFSSNILYEAGEAL